MKRIAITLALALSLFGGLAGNAQAARHLSGGGGGTPTNYGGAIINGVFVTFLCSNGVCTVNSPAWLAGRTVVYTNGVWVLK